MPSEDVHEAKCWITLLETQTIHLLKTSSCDLCTTKTSHIWVAAITYDWIVLLVICILPLCVTDVGEVRSGTDQSMSFLYKLTSTNHRDRRKPDSVGKRASFERIYLNLMVCLPIICSSISQISGHAFVYKDKPDSKVRWNKCNQMISAWHDRHWYKL